MRVPALVVLASLFHVPLAAQQPPPASPAAQAGLTVTRPGPGGNGGGSRRGRSRGFGGSGPVRF